MESVHKDLDATAQNVWQRYPLGETGRLLRLGNAGGCSGACFWRSQEHRDAWLLRGWPRGMDAGRLSIIHGLQRQARLAGLGFVPELLLDKFGQTFVSMGERLWQVESWMAG